MQMYAINYEHPNEAGWRQYLPPHIVWLQDRLADGSLIASGPFSTSPQRAAMLIMSASNREALEALIQTDPFSIEGLIENMTIREWDPIFGAFNERSSMPGQIQSR